MGLQKNIDVPKDQIAAFCKRNYIRKLAFFGSVLCEDFRPDSDVDVLVEFDPQHVPGLRIIEIEEELSAILGGRKIDLVTEKYLNHRLRDSILASREPVYAEG